MPEYEVIAGGAGIGSSVVFAIWQMLKKLERKVDKLDDKVEALDKRQDKMEMHLHIGPGPRRGL